MITSKLKDIKLNESRNYEITFEVSNYYSKLQVEQLKKDIEYKFEPKEVKFNRSIQQNKMMWEILEQIALKELNGRTDSEYVMKLYIKMLEKSGAKYEYLMALPETKEELLKTFRAIKIVEYREYNGTKMAVMKCFYGSSKMNTKEFNNLLETILDYASKLEIYVDEMYP